jgi:putative heme-binding domain-containing protein
LRQYVQRPAVRNAFERRLATADADDAEVSALVEQLELGLFPPGTDGMGRSIPRPDDVEGWRRAIASGGDPHAGERVFFAPSTGCVSCHRIQHRGRKIGPDLDNVGQSMRREQIIDSILRPSASFAPQYQAWFVELRDDTYYTGVQLDHKSAGDIELFTTEGKTRRFKASEIMDYGILNNSLMPDGLEEAMTVTEFRDLIAFLESLR